MATLNIKVTVSVSQSRPVPAQEFDHLEVSLTDAGGITSMQTFPDTTAASFDATFSNVQDGVMNATARAVDTQGNSIGTPVTGTFDSTKAEFASPTGIAFAIV